MFSRGLWWVSHELCQVRVRESFCSLWGWTTAYNVAPGRERWAREREWWRACYVDKERRPRQSRGQAHTSRRFFITACTSIDNRQKAAIDSDLGAGCGCRRRRRRWPSARQSLNQLFLSQQRANSCATIANQLCKSPSFPLWKVIRSFGLW